MISHVQGSPIIIQSYQLRQKYTILIFKINDTLQICTSMFIQSRWLDGYFTMKFPNESRRPNLPEIDFRLEGWRAFNAYAILCGLASSMVTNAMNVFLKNEFITAQALSCKYMCGVST